MTALPTQKQGALPSYLLSMLWVVVSALRQSVAVYHLLPLSLRPQSHGTAIWAVGRAGSRGARAELRAHSGVQLYLLRLSPVRASGYRPIHMRGAKETQGML